MEHEDVRISKPVRQRGVGLLPYLTLTAHFHAHAHAHQGLSASRDSREASNMTQKSEITLTFRKLVTCGKDRDQMRTGRPRATRTHMSQ